MMIDRIPVLLLVFSIFLCISCSTECIESRARNQIQGMSNSFADELRNRIRSEIQEKMSRQFGDVFKNRIAVQIDKDRRAQIPQVTNNIRDSFNIKSDQISNAITKASENKQFPFCNTNLKIQNTNSYTNTNNINSNTNTNITNNTNKNTSANTNNNVNINVNNINTNTNLNSVSKSTDYGSSYSNYPKTQQSYSYPRQTKSQITSSYNFSSPFIMEISRQQIPQIEYKPLQHLTVSPLVNTMYTNPKTTQIRSPIQSSLPAQPSITSQNSIQSTGISTKTQTNNAALSSSSLSSSFAPNNLIQNTKSNNYNTWTDLSHSYISNTYNYQNSQTKFTSTFHTAPLIDTTKKQSYEYTSTPITQIEPLNLSPLPTDWSYFSSNHNQYTPDTHSNQNYNQEFINSIQSTTKNSTRPIFKQSYQSAFSTIDKQIETPLKSTDNITSQRPPQLQLSWTNSFKSPQNNQNIILQGTILPLKN